MIYVIKINLEITTTLKLATKYPLTFLMFLDGLQDINSKVSWNGIRSSTYGKRGFFSAVLMNPRGRGRGRPASWPRAG